MRQIGTASFRTTRGYSFAAVLCDEIAFWRQDETSANPDVEILRALRPGMASIPGSVLLMASSPQSADSSSRCRLSNQARAHRLCRNAGGRPHKARHAWRMARAEYGAEFRDDLADYITREAVDAVTCWGRSELPPEPGVTYAAFCDPSGGVNDAMTLAVAHLRDGAICVLDAVLEVRPPFDPEVAVAACTISRRRFSLAASTYAPTFTRGRKVALCSASNHYALARSGEPRESGEHG